MNNCHLRSLEGKPLPSLGIIESPWRGHFWEYAKQQDIEVVTIHTSWKVTNTLLYNLTVLNVFLTKPTRAKGALFIKHHKSEIFGFYPIPQGYTTEVHASFFIDKRFVKKEDQILKVRVEFEDPIGRRHKIDNIIVEPIRKTPVKKDLSQTEDSSETKSKVEKQVVSVLKNEVEQYKVSGRKEGKLGTVEWPREGLE